MKNQLFRLLFTLLLAVTVNINMRAADGPIYYDYYTNLTATVRRASTSISGEVEIPDSILFYGKYYTVTSIGNSAFEGCKFMTSVSIPNTVTSIGAGAFERCSALTTVNIPNLLEEIQDNTFKGCSSLTSISIPNSVTSIGADAFKDSFNKDVPLRKAEFASIESLCSISFGNMFSNPLGCANHLYIDGEEITNLVIPNGVSEIKAYAFEACQYESVSIPNSVTSIEVGVFFSCSIGKAEFSSIESICNITFGEYSSNPGSCAHTIYIAGEEITNLVIPDTVTEIKDFAFFEFFSLTSVTIPNSVTSIGSEAFYYCKSLTSLAIPNSVTSIGDDAFSNCHSLTSVTISNSATSIGSGAFFYCKSLTSLAIPNSVTSIGDDAFGGCTNLVNVIIGKSVGRLGENVFLGCNNLAKCAYPDGLSIRLPANCFGLSYPRDIDIIVKDGMAFDSQEKELIFVPFPGSDVNIPETVTTIGKYAFAQDPSLTSITLNGSIENIGEYAFEYCKELSEVATPNIEKWLGINFSNEYSNPLWYAKKLKIGDEYVRKLIIPEGITRINPYAFVNCERLVTINYPSSIESIGEHAMDGCTGLRRNIFPDLISYLKINYDSYTSKLTFGNDSKVYIGDEVFNPVKLDWPESLTRIPDYAFQSGNLYADITSSLQEINIPETVSEIGQYAFWGTQLKSVQLPERLASISPACFGLCFSLESIVIPDKVTEIGERAFYCCHHLKTLTIGESVSSIGKDAFGSSSISNLRIKNLYNWGHINFSNPYQNPIYHARSLYAGDSDEPLKKLYISMPNDSIGNYAFSGAENLETVRIKAKSIGEGAFSDCNSLRELCIDTDEIGENSFNQTSGLRNLYCLRQTPPAAFDNSFSDYSEVTLFVPAESANRYENAEQCWWKFVDVIESNFSELDEIFGTPIGTGVENIFSPDSESSIDLEQPYTVYNLNGTRVADSGKNLEPGIYIVRQQNRVTKIAVR